MKMLKRRAASYGVNPEIRGPQKKTNQVLIDKNWRVSNGLVMVCDWFYSRLAFQV